MKKMVWLFGVLVMAGIVSAATLRPLLQSERAYYGATHEVEITYADLDTEDTNTADVVSFAVADMAMIQGVLLIVDEAFVGPTNNHFTLTVSAGDASSPTALLAATQLSSVATNAWRAWGAETTPLVYTAQSDTGLQFTFTPNAEDSTSEATAGRLRFLFKAFGL